MSGIPILCRPATYNGADSIYSVCEDCLDGHRCEGADTITLTKERNVSREYKSLVKN